MQLILLGGESVRNKEWIESVQGSLKDLFEKTTILYYEHWGQDISTIAIDTEAKRLEELVRDIDQYMIFAKSAGSIVTLKCIYERGIYPHKCIFLGFPVHVAKESGWQIDTWIENYCLPTLFIQKTYDPVISYTDLIAFLHDNHVTNAVTQEMPGDDHHYHDLVAVKEYVANFIKTEKK